MFNKGVGLVLGGGGAKGLAHIGVLKVLEENKIPVKCVSGTSIGAIIGAFHCLGYSASEIESIAKTTDFKDLFDFTLPKKGLIRGDKLEKYLTQFFKGKTFADLKKPLYIVACDLVNFQKVIFCEGDLLKAVRASISIPGIFYPVVSGDRVLVDGGLIDNLPVQVLKDKGIRKIIAVNLEKGSLKADVYEKFIKANPEVKIPNILETLLNSYRIIFANQLNDTLKMFKVSLVLSPDLEGVNISDFNKADLIIKRGYKVAQDNLYKIKRMSEKNLLKAIFNINSKHL